VAADASTLPALLGHNRVHHANKAAIVTRHRAITHAALDADSRALGANLVAAGVGPGARVGLLLPNGIEWAVTAAAVWRVGAVLVPLSTLLRPPELLAQLQAASITQLVLTPSFRDRSYLDDLEAVAPGVIDATRGERRHPLVPFLRSVWAVDDLPRPRVHEDLVEQLEGSVRPAHDLVVLFTSGSRGTPKGTVHTHGNALRAVASGLAARCIDSGDRLYIPMPLFWTGGLAGGLLTTLVAGATLLTEAVPEPEQTLELLERERVTIFRGWPDQAAQLAAHPRFATTDLSSLGPGSLPAVLPAAARPGPGTRANLFGMTETFGPYCGARLDMDLPEPAQGSCGRPFAGVEVRIVSSQRGEQCAPGTTGEIQVRGPNLMRAIWGRTRQATFERDGFYPTGDLGSLDVDGYLWYHGRLDDMFKVKGATVYPTEVEAAVRAIDGVRQAHVTNLPRDGGAHAIGILVVSEAPLEELVRAARSRLSAFKVPTCWLLTRSPDDVPLTATSKVDKAALQALLRQDGQWTQR